MPTQIALYLVVGAFAGTLAGLFGVGGGVVIVPAVVLSLDMLGVNDAIAIKLAIGTSLATIVITSISSVRAHHGHGNVDWPLMRRLTIGIVLGTPLGSMAAAQMPAAALERIFSAFLLLVAVKMVMGWTPSAHANQPRRALFAGAGGVIGAVSGLVGIGGGSLTVPFLAWSGTPMKKAVATSAACGVPIAVTGAISYVVAGWHNPILPEWSVGYVYAPAFLGIASASALTARVGAKLATRLPEVHLRRAFAVLVCSVAIKMLLG